MGRMTINSSQDSREHLVLVLLYKRTSSRVSIWTNTGEVILKLAAGKKENLVRYLYCVIISHEDIEENTEQRRLLSSEQNFFPESLKCFSGSRKYLCSVIQFAMQFVLLMYFIYKHATLLSFL